MKISNRRGSATGSGVVQVNGGILSGAGIVKGAVTIGNSTGSLATLAPSSGANRVVIFTTKGALTFPSGGLYTCQFNSKKPNTDQIVANELRSRQARSLI